MNIPVFVINLKRSSERRKKTCDQLDKLGITYEVIDAEDGDNYPEEYLLNNPQFGLYTTTLHSRYLFRGEIGCAMSHIKIYRKIIDESIPVSCILEDDNDFSGLFNDLISDKTLYDQNWNLLYLGQHAGDIERPVKTFNKKRIGQSGYYTGDSLEAPFGSFAYLIRKDAAMILLNNCFPLSTPFDTFLGNSAAIGVNMKVLTPPCINHSYITKSTIYNNPQIIKPAPQRKRIGEIILRLYKFFPLLKKVRIMLQFVINMILINLRRFHIISNKYSSTGN